MKHLLSIFILLFAVSCTNEFGTEEVMTDVPKKDVSFLMVTPSKMLKVSDYYYGTLQNTCTRTNVDSCWVHFNMKYGMHELHVSTDGNEQAMDFEVNESTKEAYKISVNTSVSFIFNTAYLDAIYIEY